MIFLIGTQRNDLVTTTKTPSERLSTVAISTLDLLCNPGPMQSCPYSWLRTKTWLRQPDIRNLPRQLPIQFGDAPLEMTNSPKAISVRALLFRLNGPPDLCGPWKGFFHRLQQPVGGLAATRAALETCDGRAHPQIQEVPGRCGSSPPFCPTHWRAFLTRRTNGCVAPSRTIQPGLTIAGSSAKGNQLLRVF